MWGAGVLSGLEHKRDLEYTADGYSDERNSQLSVNSDPVGHSLFFMLAHHGFGFETLLGYRMNFIKTDVSYKDSIIPSGVSYEDTNISITTSQVQLGIGVTF